MHKTGNVVVEGVAIGKIQFLNADYEEQIKRYMTGKTICLNPLLV